MKIITALLTITLVTSCASTKTSSTAAAPAVKAGMTRDQVKEALGKPAYMYSLGEEETWVYSEGSTRLSLTKDTSINMLPIAGPIISLVGKVKPKPKAAKAEVTFNAKGKATRIRETKA